MTEFFHADRVNEILAILCLNWNVNVVDLDPTSDVPKLKNLGIYQLNKGRRF